MKQTEKYYKGSHLLNLDEFPNVYEAKGPGGDVMFPGKYSNIMTGYSTYGDPDNPSSYILYPTMYQGNVLSEVDMWEFIEEKGMHFGRYDSLEEMKTVDDAIHSKFNELSDLPDQQKPFSVRRDNPFRRKKEPKPLNPGTEIFSQMFNTEIFEHPLAKEMGINDYKSLDASDLTADEKFDLILLGNRQGELR